MTLFKDLVIARIQTLHLILVVAAADESDFGADF